MSTAWVRVLWLASTMRPESNRLAALMISFAGAPL
jgi:hypothetical protein